ncbi:glycosyltransferase family 4 protein [Salinibacter sp.]|uniref:glycosyltransferase family 4 protein n=1 Tax=Salinibacter sp. TaxID=2065818 RepID=UPI0021E980A8|nr:glycosyltransferase family 4 protein [Salinibacter sp.]
MVDLTCRTPQYDRRLVEALCSIGCPVEMWAAGCYGDDLYASEINVEPGCMDIMAHFSSGSERLTKWLKAGEYLLNITAFWRRVLRDAPAIIHFQWLPLLDASKAELFVVKRIQQRGIKVVYTVHDLLPLTEVGDSISEQRQRYSTLYQQVDALICHTQESKTRLVEEFGVNESKIWHIPHGPLTPVQSSTSSDVVNVEELVPEETDGPTVVLFGVLRPYKGYDYLLETWPKVIDELDEARLIIVGRADNNVQSEIESLVEEGGIGASVNRIYRYVSDPELMAIIDAADVLVYPYRDITQSGALFTGMGEGKAIVATDEGGLGETLRDGETARLVEYGNSNQLADALVGLLRHPEKRAELGRTARRDLNTRLSWEEIAQKTIECYQSTVILEGGKITKSYKF